MLDRVLGERYALEEKIGSGGMAEVYRAHDNLLDRKVAVKILHEAYRSDKEFIEKFHREAKAAARLSHPNIVSIYDVGIEGIDHYIVMEYVQGHSLKDKIREEGALDILTATKIAKDISNGLAHAHANNLVHCDIKPHNILMTIDGHAKIADFGIARAITESTMTYSGNVIGSVHYFSPEQAQGGTVTPKSDVYSLGIVMYEMLTNHLPFTGDNVVAIAKKHVDEDPVPPSSYRPQIPPMLEAIVLRTMNKNPDLRLSSFDMIQALSNIEANLSLAQLDDPEATRILPRNETIAISPRRNIRQSAVVNRIPNKSNKLLGKSFLFSKIFMFGLIILLMFGFGAGILMAFANPWNDEEIQVPDVVGKPLRLARERLEDNNLRVNVAEVFNSDIPAGEVVSQDPKSGRNVKNQRLITIYVSKGGETITMPDIVGLTKFEATKRVQKCGLVVGSIYEKNAIENPGTVIEQDPVSGTKINRGQTIDLIISRGKANIEPINTNSNNNIDNPFIRRIVPSAPLVEVRPEKIFVPNVISATLEIAKSSFKNSGLNIGSITYQDSTLANNTVISQTPLADSYVEVGTNIDVVVSRSILNDIELEPEVDVPTRENGGIKSK